MSSTHERYTGAAALLIGFNALVYSGGHPSHAPSSAPSSLTTRTDLLLSELVRSGSGRLGGHKGQAVGFSIPCPLHPPAPVRAHEVRQRAVAAQQGGHKGHAVGAGILDGVGLGVGLPAANLRTVAVPPGGGGGGGRCGAERVEGEWSARSLHHLGLQVRHTNGSEFNPVMHVHCAA